MTKRNSNTGYNFHIKRLARKQLGKGTSMQACVAVLINLVLERVEHKLLKDVNALVDASKMSTISSRHVKAAVQANWPHKLGRLGAKAIYDAETSFKSELSVTT
jgi:histone H3/H4